MNTFVWTQEKTIMKRLTLILTSLLLFFTGINSSAEPAGSDLPSKFVSLADKAQARYAEFTKEEWKAMSEEFDALCDEYSAAKKAKSLTSEQKKTINDAIGRYQSATVKSGYNEVAEVTKDIVTKKIPDFWNETTSSISGFFKGLGSKKKK